MVKGADLFGLSSIMWFYISSNAPIERFEAFLWELRNNMNNKHSKDILVGGDFNSKSGLWGSPIDDLRGDILAEWLSERDLVVFNQGNEPTFVRENSKSWIDITFGTANFSTRIKNWKVMDDEHLSDHLNTYF